MQVKIHHLKTASLELFVFGNGALSSFISLLITQYLLLTESWHIVIYCKKIFRTTLQVPVGRMRDDVVCSQLLTVVQTIL
jgi:hypothetical protein